MIAPGGFLHPHTDDGPLKQHVVLATNDQARCISNGVSYYLEEGSIYEVDASLEHSAINPGPTDRIHLIL